MPIDTAENTSTANGELPPLKFSTNPEIQAKLNVHKQKYPRDVAYYTRVVNEAQERAVDMLLKKDMDAKTIERRANVRQVLVAKALYDAQPPEIQTEMDQMAAKMHRLPRTDQGEAVEEPPQSASRERAAPRKSPVRMRG